MVGVNVTVMLHSPAGVIVPQVVGAMEKAPASMPVIEMLETRRLAVCNGQVKPDTFSDSFPIKIPFILQRGLIT